ncbi:hypothetical protein DFJ73DRAFT_787786 [Zopfochytrium polystomum]|nr:hypothetical protein DFJ73DRAFT_787786 [Zopfochytrium polystomum]
MSPSPLFLYQCHPVARRIAQKEGSWGLLSGSSIDYAEFLDWLADSKSGKVDRTGFPTCPPSPGLDTCVASSATLEGASAGEGLGALAADAESHEANQLSIVSTIGSMADHFSAINHKGPIRSLIFRGELLAKNPGSTRVLRTQAAAGCGLAAQLLSKAISELNRGIFDSIWLAALVEGQRVEELSPAKAAVEATTAVGLPKTALCQPLKAPIYSSPKLV